ncbi:MAG: glycosyltransferase [Acetobacteraceae bacterium]|nr:glycosyltransferase [Acetobacteraceae bacterium]
MNDLLAPASSIVAICTINRAGCLPRTLAAVRLLRPPPSHILVVAGPCTDHTDEVLARARSYVSVLRCPEPNLALARNLALEAAATPILAFLDDDAVPEPDWLWHLLRAFADESVAAAGGPIRDRSGIAWQSRRLAVDGLGRRRPLDDSQPLKPDETLSLTGAGFAVRREAALAVGGFDHAYTYYLEETDLQRRLARAGWRLAFVPEAEVHHEFAASALRTDDRIPRDLRPLGRSLAYFISRHAPPGPDREDAIRRRLEEDFRERQSRLDRLVARGRLDADTAARLLAGLRDGHAEGLALAARSPPSRPVLRRVPLIAEATSTHDPPPEPRRIAIVLPVPSEVTAATAEALRLPRRLAERGHQVTLISGRAKRPSVRFRRGLWRHRLGPAKLRDRALGPRRAPRAFLADALAELLRVQPHRDAQLLVVLDRLPGRMVLLPLGAQWATAGHQTLAGHVLAALQDPRRTGEGAISVAQAPNADEAVAKILAALADQSALLPLPPFSTAAIGRR